MNGVNTTVVGRLTSDPELRFSDRGTSWTTMRIAVNYRRGDDSGQNTEETTYFSVKVFRRMAENVAESLRKGDEVVVSGRLSVNTWQSREGQERTDLQIMADTVGVSLRSATASVTRNSASDGPRYGNTAAAEPRNGSAPQAPPPPSGDDPFMADTESPF